MVLVKLNRNKVLSGCELTWPIQQVCAVQKVWIPKVNYPNKLIWEKKIVEHMSSYEFEMSRRVGFCLKTMTNLLCNFENILSFQFCNPVNKSG